MNAISTNTQFSEAMKEIPWSQAPIDARRQQLAKMFVKRDIEETIFDWLYHIWRDADLYQDVRNGIIIGETGVGKTDIAKRFLAQNPEQIDPVSGSIVRPVLYVDVRNSSTPKAVAQAMLRSLFQRPGIEEQIVLTGDSELTEFANKDLSTENPKDKDSYMFGGTSELSYRVKKQMVAQGVRIAILDEFHNTVTDNGAVRLNRIAEWVKDFAKARERSGNQVDGSQAENIAIVMVGTKKVLKIIQAPGNAEISSITPYRKQIDRYGYNTVNEKQIFRHFLDELDSQLPFDSDSNLGLPGLADKIHKVTFGLLRPLGHIITKAGEMALDDGAPYIHEHHLHLAVELMRGVLESPATSDESTKEERLNITNVFNAPLLETKPKERKRSSFLG